MNKRLLTVCYFLHLVHAKLVNKILEDSDAEVETVSVITTCRDSSGEYLKLGNENIRNPRHSSEAATKQNVTQVQQTNKPKVALVKKPIPKFIDNGSDEDYQAKMKYPNKGSESVEHEDEDFSVDDYDFDVNHDEFAGRGKPLEPRVKVSRQRKPAPAKVEQSPPSRAVPTLSQIKDMIPHSESKPSIKVVRKAATGVMREEEYDEEFSTITKSSEKPRKIATVKDISSFSEEAEDSREDEIKQRMRTARSSVPFTFGTYVDKFGEKSSEFVTKMLSYLPLFPNKFLSQDKLNENVVAENAPVVDP